MDDGIGQASGLREAFCFNPDLLLPWG